MIVNCSDVELDSGENLTDLGVGNYLELDQTTAGMEPGTWQLLAYEGGSQEKARMRRLTAEEIQAARYREANAQMYA